MTRENLIKKVKIFSGKVKSASNIATLLFLAFMAYSISKWHKVSGFDNFINVLMTIMVLIVNIRFYKIHLTLSGVNELEANPQIHLVYGLQKKEYSQLVIILFMIITSFIVFKLIPV